ncbi:MAG: hypothetical protein ACOVT5_03850, partial [Armatimonadaceae bacterium]
AARRPPGERADAGARDPVGVDGVSVTDLWQGRKPRRRPPLYWEFHERGFEQAVRDGEWKAIRNAPGEPVQLFNLRTDPGETTDVAGRHPDVARRLTRFLDTARTDSKDFPIRPRP